MDNKLTLKLDQEIIERAKQYASKKKISLSRIIENYLNSLTSDQSEKDEIQISHFVKSLSTSVELPADFDYKKAMAEHLDEKYK